MRLSRGGWPKNGGVRGEDDGDEEGGQRRGGKVVLMRR
ncbi:hypothetical protein Tco_0643128, partial [Tanacetum coccineum]